MRNRPLIVLSLFILGMFIYFVPNNIHADTVNQVSPTQQNSRVASYDISQWQGPVSNDQAKGLKKEVHFMILKAENGSLYQDPQFKQTSGELSKNRIPYGAYDYSIYNGPDQAVAEANSLYRRAPGAHFYVNDCEQNNAGDELNTATQAWADEMHQLTRKPVVLYSDLSFINGLSQSTRNAYNVVWVADYSYEPNPVWHYDLWQFTNKHYSSALGQDVDASVIPYGGRPMTFWTGHHHKRTYNVHRIKPQRKESKGIRRIKSPRTRTSRKRRGRWSLRHVSSEYYQSKNVRHLLVIHRSGINLYNLKGRYLRHVKRGTVLHVRSFRRYSYTRSTYMTRAVDYLNHRWVMYTARKSKLVPYYFER